MVEHQAISRKVSQNENKTTFVLVHLVHRQVQNQRYWEKTLYMSKLGGNYQE